MKKGLLLILTLALFVSVIFAQDYMLPGHQDQSINNNIPEKFKVVQPTRPDTCVYNFSVDPITLVMSYYDYMIGGYNDIPLCVQPDPAYGGYFMTFHGQRTAAGQRRAFYSYIDDNGVVQNMNEITNVQNWEGYPSISVDPVSGKPIYAWHVNADADVEYEVQYAYDAFLSGAAGLISDPVVIVDNPTTMPAPYNTTDNEFIWPTVQIGPSPNAGMRRVYIVSRNAQGHVGTTTNASENVWINYADFNGDMLEMGTPLTWSHTTIPTLDAWNHAFEEGTSTPTDVAHRPNCAFVVGNDGRIYYTGYHFAYLISNSSDVIESDLDTFVCDNYGEGTWTRVQGSSEYSSWNPQQNFGTGAGYFTGSDNTTPVPSADLFWGLSNSAHINAVMDDSGKIHMLGIWAQQFTEDAAGVLSTYFHGTLQNVKELIYDTNSQLFSFREVYPMAGTPTDNLLYLPWDTNADGFVDEFDSLATSSYYGDPMMESNYPFPYWDDTVHTNAMMFHYSNTKISEPNEQGMMVAVWEDSNRARLYNMYATDYPELAPFTDTPEIMISASPDNGFTWSEPFSLNKVETPELAGMRPMWTYPADHVKYVTTNPDGRKVGKLGMLFYDDFSWGAYVVAGPVGQNTGGNVKFAELEITFPLSTSIDNPVATPVVSMLKQNYPNPFNPETTIKFDLPKSGAANLSIYNTKGQLVKTLVSGVVSKGEQKFSWKGTDNFGNVVASGLYFYKLNANGKTETRKMMLMK